MVDIKAYGYTENDSNASDIARVTAVHKERYEIICAQGDAYAKLKPSAFFTDNDVDYPTVGDFVRIRYNPSGDSMITAVLPRRSYFSRMSPHPGRGEQAIAANIDYAFLLTSLNRDFNLSRLERYLTVTAQSGATPVIVLTKADMCMNGSDAGIEPVYAEQLRAVVALAPGVNVYAVSAHTGFGMDALNEYLQPGKTLALLGSSGVGKSSLLNAIAGENLMKVNVTRDVDSSKGRHTTTYRQLTRLPSGVMIIDTPGMRELGMWEVEEGLGNVFADIEELAAHCRFSDCKHQNEPGCAIRAALASGELSVKHWENYIKLKRESSAAEHIRVMKAKRRNAKVLAR